MLNYLAKKLVRLAYPHGATRKILRGPLKGLQFLVTPGYGFTFASAHPELHLDSLASIVKPGMTVFDIGANRGHIALLFSRLVGNEGVVFAFEPVIDLKSDFEKNLKCNHISNVKFINVALSDSVGSVAFEYSKNQATQGRIQGVLDALEVNNPDLLTVPGDTLDNFCSTNPKPDLIKIDVEGAGAMVLAGGQELIRRSRPTIFIELHGPEEQKAVKDLIISNNYSAFELDGEKIDDVCVGWHSPVICQPNDS